MYRKLILGTSGAVVLRGTRATLKAHPGHPNLVLAQAAYMRNYGSPFAHVLRVGAMGYATPTLYVPRDSIGDLLMLARLSLSYLWAQPATVPGTWSAEHWQYVEQLCTLHCLPWVRRVLYEAFTQVLRNPGPECATHGDATLDNLLVDAEGKPQWIDPIPPTAKVPAFLTVDLGKLLQSAYGYEHVKYGRRWQVPSDMSEDNVLHGWSAPVKFAARYWYWIHVLRLLRYAMPHVKKHYMEVLNEIHI